MAAIMTNPTGNPQFLPVADGDLDVPLHVPEDGVTEILVHGVGGALPAAMLGEPVAQQVTGDRTAGMWRGADRDARRAGDGRWHREAYSWGGLTSRAFVSALWLVLTPFALLNLAGWTALGRPRKDDERPDWRVAYQQALVRVLGFVATLTYVLFVAQIAMDLGTWQCTQVDDCRLRTWPRGILPWLAGHPTRAVALAALVPIAAVVALGALTRQSIRRYETYDPTQPNEALPNEALPHEALPNEALPNEALPNEATPGSVGPAADGLDLTRTGLTDRRFWQGQAYATRIRQLHLMGSTLLVALLLLAVAHTGGRWSMTIRGLLWTTAVALAVCVVGVGSQRVRNTLLGEHRAPPGGEPAGRRIPVPVRAAAGWVFVSAVTAAAAVLAFAQPAPPTAAAHSVMPGILEAFNALVVLVVVVGLLHGVIAFTARAAAGDSYQVVEVMLPRIPAPFIAVTVAVWLLFAVWTGVVVWVARWLSPSAKPSESRLADHLVYPAPYRYLVQFSVISILITVVVVAAMLLVWIAKHRLPDLDEERAAWDRQTLAGSITPSRRWTRRVSLHKLMADAAFWVERLLSVIAVLATAGAVAFTVWLGFVWLGRRALLVFLAVLVACAGLTFFAWLVIRTEPPADGARTGRSRRDRLVVAGGGLVFAAGLGLAVALCAPLLARFGERPPVPLLHWRWLLSDGLTSTILTAIPVSLILVVRQAIRNQNTRRLIGTAWDVATFWPRGFHPLAPPSYAERAVPELAHRVRHLLAGGNAVLVLGHSQGAMLVTATLAQLTDLYAASSRRLSIVMYGNPVAHLYMRWFPRYVNRRLLTGLGGAAEAPEDRPGVPHLANFYRHTDPIGRRLDEPPAGPAADRPPTRDRWLPDPPTNRYRPLDGVPTVRGHAHAGYVRQSQFAAYVAEEVRTLDSALDPGP
jgi:hypothetical protein